MSAAEWAGFAVALMTLLAGFNAAIRWLVKHYLTELKPNSGSSMRDSLDRLELRIDSLYELVAGKNRE